MFVMIQKWICGSITEKHLQRENTMGKKGATVWGKMEILRKNGNSTDYLYYDQMYKKIVEQKRNQIANKLPRGTATWGGGI